MVLRRELLWVWALVGVLCLGAEAKAAELSSDYLLGTWLIDSTDCADNSAEFVIFRDTGAVESVREGKLEAAGFWEIVDDTVVVHVVASPAFFHGDREGFEGLKAFEGQYDAFRIRVVPFNVEPDSFGAIGLLGEQVSKGSFTRCKN
jgi:hypothetical protein